MLRLQSNIEIRVLEYFFINSEEKKYVSELSRILIVDKGNLDRKLKELKQEGILNYEIQGNQKYYFLNKEYPLLKEIKKIFTHKYGLEKSLKEIFSKIKGIDQAYIFGSFAQSTFEEGSDIDILVIGNHSIREVQYALLEKQDQLQREFNVIHMSSEEFLQKKEQKNPFIENIFKQPIIKII